MHHRLEPCPDRAKTGQPQQVHRRRAQSCHDASTVAAVAVSVLAELGVADPVPALEAPSASHQLHQGVWRGAEAGDEVVRRRKGPALSRAAGGHLDDPAGAVPLRFDRLGGFFRSQAPGDVTAMTNFAIDCSDRNLPFADQLADNLRVQGSLVRFDRQEEVGPLLLELLKNGCCVCSASAWISTPSRSSSPNSFLRTERS